MDLREVASKLGISLSDTECEVIGKEPQGKESCENLSHDQASLHQEACDHSAHVAGAVANSSPGPSLGQDSMALLMQLQMVKGCLLNEPSYVS